MTENEAVNRLNNHTQYYVPTEDLEALDMVIEALEEVQEYRKIGTVEECREAVERSKARKPVPDESAFTINGIIIYDTWYCPNCGQQYEKYYEEYKCCPECGQKIDWSNEMEKWL